MPSDSHSGNRRNFKRLALITTGMLLGGFFLYISFRDISWKDLTMGIMQMKVIYLIPCTFLAVACQVVRSVRFAVILRPFCDMSIKSIWDLMNLWAAANMIMPARLGELVRPYLLKKRGTSFSSALGAVMVERFFDLSALLLLLGVVLWRTPQVPASLSWIGLIMLGVLIVSYAFVLLLLAQRQRVPAILKRILSVLPKRLADAVGGVIFRLIDGLEVMGSLKQALVLFTYSVILWGLFSCVTYGFLLAFSVDAPFLVSLTIQVFLSFGVALPSAPGFVGTFHAAGRYALALFGINAVVAVSFATVYHLFSLVISLSLGFISYLTSDFRFDHEILSGRLESE